MEPRIILIALGGYFVITVGTFWVLFRLGRFTLTTRERRAYPLLVGLVVVWVLVLALIGPLPLPVVIAMNVVTLGLFVFWWRTGRFSLEKVPDDVRPEAEYRRQWMREHRGVLIGLFAAYMLLSIVWLVAVVVFVLSQRP